MSKIGKLKLRHSIHTEDGPSLRFDRKLEGLGPHAQYDILRLRLKELEDELRPLEDELADVRRLLTYIVEREGRLMDRDFRDISVCSERVHE